MPLTVSPLVLALASTAVAHPIGVSTLYAEVDGATVEIALDLHPRTVVDVLPALDLDGDRELGADEVVAGADVLRAYVDRTIRLAGDGAPCTSTSSALRLVADTRLKLDLVVRCPASPTSLAWRVDALMEDEGGHTVLGRFRLPSGYVQHAFRPDAREHVLALRAASPPPGAATPPSPPPAPPVPGAGQVLATFVGEGLRHLLGGPDHLAFVVALGVATRSLRSLAAAVTAFTLGHSLSLALVVLDLVRLPAALVEPAIALTIVAVAVENVVRSAPAPHRAQVSLAFGAVHGLGFGSALRELGLPTGGVVPALLGFNLGVEVGQLLVVLPLVPLVGAASAHPSAERRLVRGVSVAVALAGLGWLVERTLGLGS